MATSILEQIKQSFDLEEQDDLVLEVPKKKEELVIPVQEAPEFDLNKIHCPVQTPHNEESIKDSIDTGFDIESSLDYKPCSPKPFNQPLYKENFLGEFETEEEQRMARHNLGLFDDKDVVAMSLITTGDVVSDIDILDQLQVKTINQGYNPLAIQTVAKAVMVKEENKYTPLQEVLENQSAIVQRTNSRIDQLLNKSTGSDIKTVGDINYFLQGFKNTESLIEIVRDHLLFESRGIIEQQAWQI